jgi:DNA polymerase III subunit epsilon
MPGAGFAVIDFETTGLFPGGHDRVIEIAVVHVDPSGEITGQWDTLVNPARDLGPQHIHRIKAADVLDAPTFADIAPDLIRLISGRVLVAHNASFDSRFLVAELERLGHWPVFTSLCTMQLAREFIPGAGRSLQDCCDAFGIPVDGAHRASVDALATAQLLGAYLANSSTWEGWGTALAQSTDWDVPPSTGVPWKPRPFADAEPANFLERITVKLPEFSGPAEHLDYLALLDRCLLDRQISAHEANSLVNLAETLGIGRSTCAALHQEYFDQLTAVAWADGVLTDDEKAQVISVGRALGLAPDSIEAAMIPREVSLSPVAAFELVAGDYIVLTGDMLRPRDEWHSELHNRGFVPWAAVTKKVKLVAAADPDSLSGKARKARDYGIPIVGEQGLADLLARLP